MIVFIKILVSSVIIAVASSLAKNFPSTAGYLVGALPITTALTLAFTQLEHGDSEKSFLLARSVLIAVMLSVVYFIPYLIAPKLKLNFWSAYALAIVFVLLMYPVHSKVMAFLK